MNTLLQYVSSRRAKDTNLKRWVNVVYHRERIFASFPSLDRAADKYEDETGELLGLTDREVQKYHFKLSPFMRRNLNELTSGATKLHFVKALIAEWGLDARGKPAKVIIFAHPPMTLLLVYTVSLYAAAKAAGW